MKKFNNLLIQYQKNKKNIDKSINKVLNHGNFIMGKEVLSLEKKLKKFTKSKYCITVSSGTDALLISLMSLNIKPGDEVITTSFSWISTAEVIVNLGAKPVFIDVDNDTGLIKENLVKKIINKKTKALIIVSLFGQIPNIDYINSICKKKGIPVIEDAAQSFGSKYKNKYSCNLTTIGCTSFFPTKNLGCYGDGGAIFTNDDSLAEECKAIRIHGTKTDRYNSERIGLNGRFDSIQAAVVLEKLTIFDEELEMRNKVNSHYQKYLNNAQYLPKDYQSAHALFSVVLGTKTKRDDLVDRLSKREIPSVIYYKFPIHLMKAFSYLGYKEGCLPISEQLSKTIVSLPMHPYLALDDIDYIVKNIRSIR